jgi:uncharacterized protein (UPF0254 family)
MAFYLFLNSKFKNMKALKFILFGLLAIVALLLISAIFIRKQYEVRKSIVIHQPKQVVYDYVKIFKNQKDYSVWVMADSAMIPTITGTDGTVGSSQNWDSKLDDVGQGSQTITAMTEDRIDVDLNFVRPMKSTAKAANLFKAIDSLHCELTSVFYGDDKYPFNLLSKLFGEKIIADAEVQNLTNIKNILEK